MVLSSYRTKSICKTDSIGLRKGYMTILEKIYFIFISYILYNIYRFRVLSVRPKKWLQSYMAYVLQRIHYPVIYCKTCKRFLLESNV